jgi:chaperonin GroEL
VAASSTRAVVDEVKKLSIPVAGQTDIEHIAAIAANDPEIGQLLAEAMEKVGRDGVISVEEGKSLKVEVEYTEGIRWRGRHQSGCGD